MFSHSPWTNFFLSYLIHRTKSLSIPGMNNRGFVWCCTHLYVHDFAPLIGFLFCTTWYGEKRQKTHFVHSLHNRILSLPKCMSWYSCHIGVWCYDMNYMKSSWTFCCGIQYEIGGKGNQHDGRKSRVWSNWLDIKTLDAFLPTSTHSNIVMHLERARLKKETNKKKFFFRESIQISCNFHVLLHTKRHNFHSNFFITLWIPKFHAWSFPNSPFFPLWGQVYPVDQCMSVMTTGVMNSKRPSSPGFKVHHNCLELSFEGVLFSQEKRFQKSQNF